MEENKDNLKLKISKSLHNLNQSSQVFDDMINDYNTLYKKYLNVKKFSEQTQRINSFVANKNEDFPKVDQELEKNYNTLLEKYSKEKSENEKNIEKINQSLNQILDLKNKIDIKDKKINGYSAENSALKQQNMILDKKNKELNETNNRNNKFIFELNKYNQKLEIDHKTLIDSAGKMHMEIEKLRARLLELQEQIINKENSYNELIENSKKNQLSKSISPFSINNKLNVNVINEGHEKGLPDKLKSKIKLHYNSMTSISFNKSFSSYLTTGKDNMVHMCKKNNEIFEFCDFSSVVTEASFDNKDEFLLAGSYDKVANLYSLKNNKLINTFVGHTDIINCVKSFKTKQHGITGSSDKTIKEWDYNSTNMIREYDYDSDCYSLDISQDDNFILSGHSDGCVKFWSTKDKTEKIFDIQKEKVKDVKIIKSDLFLTLGREMKFKLFDMRKEDAIYSIGENITPEEFCESSIAISPDKKNFAIGTNKGMIYIYNLNDGKLISKINNNRGIGSVTALNWNANTSEIYAGDSNGFLSIWGIDLEI